MDGNLFVAARIGDVETLRNLLPENNNPAALPQSSKWTPLHIACLSGKVDFAREFLRRRPQFLKHENPDGCTALHLASSIGDLQMVMLLLTFGRDDESMDREFCLKKDNDKRNPLHHAVIKGSVEVVSKLLEACPESALEVTAQKETIFHLAVKHRVSVSGELFSQLLGGPYTEHLLNFGDKKGNTVLHLASVRKQTQIIRLLTGWRPNLDANAVNSAGLTQPSLDAKAVNSTGITRPRLDVNAVNSTGLTPLDLLVVDPMNVTDMEIEGIITSKGGIRLNESEEQREYLKSIASWILVMASVTAAASCQIAVFLKGGFWQNSSPVSGGNVTLISNSTNFWAYTSPSANSSSIVSNTTTAIQKADNTKVLHNQHGKTEPASLPYLLASLDGAAFLLSICLIVLVLFPTSTNKSNLVKWLFLRYLTYGSTVSLGFLFWQLVTAEEDLAFQNILSGIFLVFLLVIVILIAIPLFKIYFSYRRIRRKEMSMRRMQFQHREKNLLVSGPCEFKLN
ncbi:ankyrin repeat-containing protein BDA1 [Manihot esculenta]|uniref:Uncharacterized protein n=1 Tax=Manihot esculenta TaxID=3983 RepID=A0ACB7H4S3_MANES|nr:ankyrin repeat-containing protein BDA1 [Manihot esculenta]KAG8647196.1 hypothetical protein MANES_09G064600v8 [Manihot esculenta]